MVDEQTSIPFSLKSVVRVSLVYLESFALARTKQASSLGALHEK